MSTKGTDHAKELCGPFRNFDASLTDFDLTVSGSSLRRYPRLMDREEANKCLHGLDLCRIEKRHFEFELASCSLSLSELAECSSTARDSSEQLYEQARSEILKLSQFTLNRSDSKGFASQRLKVASRKQSRLNSGSRLVRLVESVLYFSESRFLNRWQVENSKFDLVAKKPRKVKGRSIEVQIRLESLER